MGRNWTEEQQKVIDTRGRSLLVSAAAGSGKTAVLVERILKEILDAENPVDLDRLLIVTFTRAATAQLRERIRDAVTGEYEKDPENVKLQHQMSLLGCDHIMTIDRFFLMVIRDHYEEIGLDPSFRIGDEGELKLMRSDVIGQVLEEAYEEGNEDFLRFSESYAPGNSDAALENMVLGFWESSTSHAYPSAWRHDCADRYEEDPSDWKWLHSLLAAVKSIFEDIRETIQRTEDLCEGIGGPKSALPTLRSDEELTDRLICSAEKGYDALYAEMTGMTFAKIVKKPKKGEPPYDPELTKQVSDLRDAWKKQLQAVRDKYFMRTLRDEAALMKKTGIDLGTLVKLADRFEEAFHEAKTQKNILDFTDTAHLALQVLLEKGEDGKIHKTRAAGEYQDFFEEISIDEYQDSNEVQELLLSAVSREERGQYNRFMVGDVKQSIYRFRMSDPGFFMDKYETYRKEEKGAEDRQLPAARQIRIDLHKNFRSRKEVLDAVNLIFRQIMRKEVGGVSYGPEESLYPGAVYEKLSGSLEGQDERIYQPELLLIQPDDVVKEDAGGENGDKKAGKVPDAKHAEAEAVAERILRIVDRDPVWDKENNEYRPARFGDIVILLRSASDWANTFSRVLSEHGIPNQSGSRTGYFSAPEVQTILAYLNVLDNPRQDIPLAAVLRSEIGRLDDGELARVKTGRREMILIDCVTTFLNEQEGKEDAEEEDRILAQKLRNFTDMTESLRDKIADTPIHLLLWKIFDETGFLTIMEAQAGGKQKKANLDMLVEKAIAYEKTSYRGLFHFVRYIEKLIRYEVDFGSALQDTGSENLVRIMTIHSSKGLEFPIVFVSGLGRKFNKKDASDNLVRDPEIGVGMNYVDPDLRVQIPTLIKSAAAERTVREGIGEELRVLYVALTRAEEKLVLTGCVPDRVRFLAKLFSCAGCRSEKLPVSEILGAENYLFWILAALVRHPAEMDFFSAFSTLPLIDGTGPVSDLPGSFRILTGEEVISGGEILTELEEADILSILRSREGEVSSQELKSQLDRQLGSTYPYPDLSRIPAKVTVSELKRAGYEAEIARLDEEKAEEVPLAKKGSDDLIVPDFMKETEKKRKVAGAALGTVYHKILADIDFTKTFGEGEIEAWLETMVRCDKITEDERSAVSVRKLDRFLHSRLAKKMQDAAMRDTLRRENPFVLAQDAGDLFPDLIGQSKREKVLIQGTIDAWMEDKDGKLILIDYKTDYVKKGEEESLVLRYRTQFLLYARALSRLTGKEVKEAWLYSLTLGKAIKVDLTRASAEMTEAD